MLEVIYYGERGDMGIPSIGVRYAWTMNAPGSRPVRVVLLDAPIDAHDLTGRSAVQWGIRSASTTNTARAILVDLFGGLPTSTDGASVECTNLANALAARTPVRFFLTDRSILRIIWPGRVRIARLIWAARFAWRRARWTRTLARHGSVALADQLTRWRSRLEDETPKVEKDNR